MKKNFNCGDVRAHLQNRRATVAQIRYLLKLTKAPVDINISFNEAQQRIDQIIAKKRRTLGLKPKPGE